MVRECVARRAAVKKKPTTDIAPPTKPPRADDDDHTVRIINLGDPHLDLASAARKAEDLLQRRIAFKEIESNRAVKLLSKPGALRAIRDFGIVGAAEATVEEVAQVKAAITTRTHSLRPVLEALSLQKTLWSASEGGLAVILLPTLMATWHRYDLRYHARTLLAGYPTLLSLPGLVEAPTKPKEYYILQSRGAKGPEFEEMFRGRFLTHSDDLSPYLGNYLAAAGAYYLLGKAFCDFPGCALYDSHWQKEVLEAPSRSLCERHERKLAALG